MLTLQHHLELGKIAHHFMSGQSYAVGVGAGKDEFHLLLRNGVEALVDIIDKTIDLHQVQPLDFRKALQ